LRKRASEEAIIAARLTLVENIKRDIHKQVEAAAEQTFRDKVKSGDIVFKLLAAPLDEFIERYTTHIALLVLETKGKHLEGSEDTQFKEKFFKLLEEAYALGREAGEVEMFANSPKSMRFRILLQEQAWQNDLETALLTEQNTAPLERDEIWQNRGIPESAGI
jgi:preprotein translocase subunit SecA